jgi:xylulokinase
MSLLLAADAGTTSLKVGLFDTNGSELVTVAEEYALSTPEPNRVELSPAVYWDALIAGVSDALNRAGARGSDVEALGLSSQGETVIPLSAAGNPLGPAIVWLDNRAVDESREIAAQFDPPTVYAATGVPTVAPTWTACKLLWWRRHQPNLFHAAAHFLLVEELLLHHLTGRYVSDAGVQSTSLLYDIAAQGWWQPMLELINISPSRLGELVMPGEVVGTLTPAAAEALGLHAGVRVVAGGMDQGAGAVGVGNVAPGMLSESTGGALTVQATIDRPNGDRSGQTPVYVHSAPGSYLYCPVCPTGGMTLTWFRDHFGQAELDRSVADGRTTAYDLLTALAAGVPAGAEGLIMLPHLSGAFSPEYEPMARGVLFGLTLSHGRAHVVRAILEAVAFMLRRNVELLRGIGASAGEIRSHGGGARSPLWNQMKADVCSLPVVTLRGSEAAVRGDAMLAGLACGAFASLAEASDATVHLARRFEPDSGTAPAYDAAYRRYIELFDTLRPLFHQADDVPAPEEATSHLAREDVK